MVGLTGLKGWREDLAVLRWEIWTAWIGFKLRRRERRLARGQHNKAAAIRLVK
jgi:hypothetical protein